MTICKIPCEVYSRVVGYLRPVSGWNVAKKQEFKDRLTYDIGDNPTFRLEFGEDTKALLETMKTQDLVDCILYGHDYRSDVIGIDGTICVRCGESPIKQKEL